jgi:hypothetical protein
VTFEPHATAAASAVVAASSVRGAGPATLGDKVTDCIHSHPLNAGIGNNPINRNAYIAPTSSRYLNSGHTNQGDRPTASTATGRSTFLKQEQRRAVKSRPQPRYVRYRGRSAFKCATLNDRARLTCLYAVWLPASGDTLQGEQIG